MRAYERLLKYAKVYTTSDPESGTHPSAAREFDLAHLLVEEMKSIGIEDAFVDEHCYVYGSIPATKGCEKKPALGLIAHMDTAPDAPGENVKPILHENYDGGDVTLPGTGMVMKTSTFPFLKELKGETLITTDGTTLLGADDKSGVAEILTVAETLIKRSCPTASSASPLPPMRRSARALLSSTSRASAQTSPTPSMAATWAASSMRTSTPHLPLSPSTASPSTPAAPRTL